MASNKNITMKEFNGTNYDTLYPKTLDSQGLLTDVNSTSYGVNTVAEALNLIYNSITILNKVRLKVVDPSGAVVVGSNILVNNNVVGTTNSNGEVIIAISQNVSSVTVQNTNNYMNYQDTVITILNEWLNDNNYHEVNIQGLSENSIQRYTESAAIKFSPSVKNVDACIVGAGSAGETRSGFHSSDMFSSYGGGSGGILNTYSIAVDSTNTYNIVVGASEDSVGGSSSFVSYSATGASGQTGGSPNGLNGADRGGQAGNGAEGLSNTTISEFDDGVTFYGGSGASGDSTKQKAGGTPYGGAGGYPGSTTTNHGADATGYGGGGGGGFIAPVTAATTVYGGKGYQGLVAIRVHYN